MDPPTLAAEAGKVIVTAHRFHHPDRSISTAGKVCVSHSRAPLRRLPAERKGYFIGLIVGYAVGGKKHSAPVELREALSVTRQLCNVLRVSWQVPEEVNTISRIFVQH